MGAPALSVTTLLREKPRSTGCTVAQPDSSVGAPAPARGKDHVGAFLRMTAILLCGVFPDSVSHPVPVPDGVRVGLGEAVAAELEGEQDVAAVVALVADEVAQAHAQPA